MAPAQYRNQSTDQEDQREGGSKKQTETWRQRYFPCYTDAEKAVIGEGWPGWDRVDATLVTLAKRWVRTILVGVAVGWAAYQGVGNNWVYSRGVRTGMVNQISQKGAIWTTYEGQMALEGIVSQGAASGANVWNFSIDNNAKRGENIDGLAKKLEQFCEQRQIVKVRYVQQFSTWPWRAGTTYLIQSVEPAGPGTREGSRP